MAIDRISSLEKMLLETPQDPFLHYALALEHLGRSLDEGVLRLEAVRSQFADYLPTYFHLADCYCKKGLFQQAIEVYEQGIVLASLQKDLKTQAELRNALQNLLFDLD